MIINIKLQTYKNNSSMNRVLFSAVLVLAMISELPNCHSAVFTFEGLPDSTPIDEIYSPVGVHFAHAVALTAGVSLNEFDFPPHSGSVAVSDDGWPIRIAFDSPASQISAWFAHAETLTFTAFNPRGEFIGAYVDPVGSSLGSDELISLGFSDVGSLLITAPDPVTYVMDDLSFRLGQPVPDGGGTGSLALVAFCFLFLAVRSQSSKLQRHATKQLIDSGKCHLID